MVSISLQLDNWVTHPLGKVARAALAVVGMATAVLVLLMGTILQEGAWLFLLLGTALAANSVRAARAPSLVRLTTLAANLVAIPVITSII